SRRRHTRSDRDWSSDVCSSDLAFADAAELQRHIGMACDLDTDLNFVNRRGLKASGPYRQSVRSCLQLRQDVCSFTCSLCLTDFRSEERRVGKECRCRWWPSE